MLVSDIGPNCNAGRLLAARTDICAAATGERVVGFTGTNSSFAQPPDAVPGKSGPSTIDELFELWASLVATTCRFGCGAGRRFR